MYIRIYHVSPRLASGLFFALLLSMPTLSCENITSFLGNSFFSLVSTIIYFVLYILLFGIVKRVSNIFFYLFLTLLSLLFLGGFLSETFSFFFYTAVGFLVLFPSSARGWFFFFFFGLRKDEKGESGKL